MGYCSYGTILADTLRTFDWKDYPNYLNEINLFKVA